MAKLRAPSWKGTAGSRADSRVKRPALAAVAQHPGKIRGVRRSTGNCAETLPVRRGRDSIGCSAGASRNHPNCGYGWFVKLRSQISIRDSVSVMKRWEYPPLMNCMARSRAIVGLGARSKMKVVGHEDEFVELKDSAIAICKEGVQE